MNVDWTMIIIAVVGGSLAAIPGILALRGQYQKESADASSINVDTALKLMKKLETKYERMSLSLDVMSMRLDDAERRENEYIRCLRKLIRQLESLNITPIVTLDDVNAIAREVQE